MQGSLFVSPGTVIANYRVEDRLAAGGMAEVFQARHVVLPRKVALKVMHPELLRLPGMQDRFMREACILESFTHPGSIRVFECGILPDGRPWMAMELVTGEPLSSRMDTPMEAAQVCRLLYSVCETLAAAHAAGLIHRDLKPDNILLSTVPGAYPVRVIDWGLARQDGVARLTKDGTASGTPMYMAPEQARCEPFDHRVDLFALGVIVYELLSGEVPFEGSAIEIALANANKEPPLFAERVPGLEVDTLVELFARKLMARRVEDRVATARAALDLLDLMDLDRRAAASELGVIDVEKASGMITLPAGPKKR